MKLINWRTSEGRQDVMIFCELNDANCNWLQYSNCVTCTCYGICQLRLNARSAYMHVSLWSQGRAYKRSPLYAIKTKAPPKFFTFFTRTTVVKFQNDTAAIKLCSITPHNLSIRSVCKMLVKKKTMPNEWC